MVQAVGAQPVFYYDLGDPSCYLVAERIMAALPVAPEWEPVLGSELGASGTAPERSEIERAAVAQGLQPFRWPDVWPPDTRFAMLAATYAKRIGRAVAFSLAAFRQAFAGGGDLGDQNTVLIAAAACEMHPTALLKALELRSIGEALSAATTGARAAGVVSLPAVAVGGRVFCGGDAVESAAGTLGAAP